VAFTHISRSIYSLCVQMDFTGSFHRSARLACPVLPSLTRCVSRCTVRSRRGGDVLRHILHQPRGQTECDPLGSSLSSIRPATPRVHQYYRCSTGKYCFARPSFLAFVLSQLVNHSHTCVSRSGITAYRIMILRITGHCGQ
jgi:hypothetical protein